MKVVFEEDFSKVWSDGYSPIVFAVLYHMPESIRFKAMCEAHTKLVKRLSSEFKGIYSIFNMAEAQPIPLEALFLYHNVYLPQQFESGLRYKAYVKPRNLFSQFSLEEVVNNSDPGKVGTFNSFEDALQAVNKKRSSSLSLPYGQTVL